MHGRRERKWGEGGRWGGRRGVALALAAIKIALIFKSVSIFPFFSPQDVTAIIFSLTKR